MYRIAIDEIPLSKTPFLSHDYIGKLIYRLLGKNLIKLNGKEIISDINICISENTIYIEDKTSNDIIVFLKEKLDNMYKLWCGVYKIFFLGIELNKKEENNYHIYHEYKQGIYIRFLNEERIYPFLCLLNSHYMNIAYSEEEIVWTKHNRKIILQNSILGEKIKFYKIKNGFLNILLFKLKVIDITSNTCFPQYLYKYYKNSKQFRSINSGIECVLISNNRKSIVFQDKCIRNRIFSALIDLDIASKLPCNLTCSNMMLNYINESINDKKITISLAFDNYYPNKIIVKELKKHLSKKNIYLKIVEQDFFEPSNETDLKLYLFSNDFDDDVFKYYFISLFTGLNQNKNDFNKFMHIIKSYFSFEINQENCINELKTIIANNSLYYSVGEIKSSFLSRDRQLDSIYYIKYSELLNNINKTYK